MILIILIFFAFIVGLMYGSEKERSRIQNIFRIKEGYSYSKFYDILEEYSEEEAGRKAMEKFNKKRGKNAENRD